MNKTVVIDPGHGGTDPGAESGGVRESTLTLDVGLRVAQELLAREVLPVLTRTTDTTVSLDFRVGVERLAKPDLFVSIHCNAAEDTRANGMEVWTSPGQTAADLAASLVLKEMARVFPDRRIRADWEDGDPDREARFYVLRKTRCPAILVEMEFLTSGTGWAFLVSPVVRAKMAGAIAQGIVQFFKEGQT